MEYLASVVLDIGAWHWLTLAVVLIGIEMIMPTQYLIWPGIAAGLVGFLSFILELSWPIELGIFSLLSVGLVAASHYMPKQALEPTTLNQRMSQMIGRSAVVADDFVHGEGAVTVGDTRWQAVADDGRDYSAGTKVQIVSSDNTVLRVKATA